MLFNMKHDAAQRLLMRHNAFVNELTVVTYCMLHVQEGALGFHLD